MGKISILVKEPNSLVDSDDRGSGGVKNGIAPSINMPCQSLLSDIIDVHTEAETGATVDVEHIPSHENIWIIPKFNVTKTDTFTLFKLGPVPSPNFLRIYRSAKDVWFVLGIGDPTCLSSVKDCVIPRLDVESESVDVYVRGSCLETPVTAFFEIDVVEEDNDLGRGDKLARKVDALGGRGFGVRDQVTEVLANQELQIGRGKIERVGNSTGIGSVSPRGDVVGGGSSGDILCCRFGTNVSIVGCDIELANSNGKTGRGDKWTSKIDTSEGVRLRFGPRTDGLGVKFANGRHYVLQQT